MEEARARDQGEWGAVLASQEGATDQDMVVEEVQTPVYTPADPPAPAKPAGKRVPANNRAGSLSARPGISKAPLPQKQAWGSRVSESGSPRLAPLPLEYKPSPTRWNGYSVPNQQNVKLAPVVKSVGPGWKTVVPHEFNPYVSHKKSPLPDVKKPKTKIGSRYDE